MKELGFEVHGFRFVMCAIFFMILAVDEKN